MLRYILYDYLYMYYFKDMQIGKNIKKLREAKGLRQKEVAAIADIHPSNYSKIEKGEREPSTEALDKIAQLFGVTIDQVVHLNGNVPKEITVEDKGTTEQLKLLQQLDEEDRKAAFRVIDTMLTKKKFQTFFEQNIQPSK